MFINTEITQRSSIREMVKAYELEISKIESSYKILREAQENLKQAFHVSERYDVDFGVLPGRHKGYNDNVDDNSFESVKDVIKRKVWRSLYNLLEVDRVASIQRRDEISAKLENGELPEITIQNIFDLFETLNQNINDFAKESVLEVYKWLRPHEGYYEMRTYKTNQKNARFEIGKKVIKNGMVRNKYGGGFQAEYYHDKYLIALDKVFHMLDGKSMLDKSYRSVLVDAINSSTGSEVETEYFFCRMYQNGNLHIEFKRLDLLKQFNVICGGMNLKPNN